MYTVRDIHVEGGPLDVHCPKGGFRSLRMLLADAGMGFSVHKTIIPAGEPQRWHYKSHKEACYCIEGYGWLKEEETNKGWKIEPGVMYVLDDHKAHTFQAVSERVVLISIFNPPCTGTEVHREDGSYAPAEAMA